MKTVYYLGIPGTYSYLAAQAYYPDQSEITLVGQPSFQSIFQAVMDDPSHIGIIPVENSLAGSVYDTYDLLYKHPVTVIGEQYLRIDLHLLGVHSAMPPQTRIDQIKTVVSHYKALEQCQNFLASHKQMKPVAKGDTAAAAKFVADQHDPFLAAIASRETAEIHGLEILQEDIHDNPFNYTRFLFIKAADKPSQHSLSEDNRRPDQAPNKASVIFRLAHEPGSLYQVLKILADAGMNLDKIESRPIAGKPFEYVFYLDFDWKNQDQSAIERLITQFSQHTLELKVLGHYQSGSIPHIA